MRFFELVKSQFVPIGSIHIVEHRTPAKIALELTHLLKNSDVFLRIGLARGWKEYPERCYLQITGIYTFPDYLNGKTFAEFKLKQGVLP